MQEVALLLAGAVIGLMSALVVELVRQRYRRDELRDDLFRQASANFVGLATKARYEYERLADSRHRNADAAIPQSLDLADSEFAQAFHRLTLIANTETLAASRRLRIHLEEMKHWAAQSPTEDLTAEQVGQWVSTAWILRDELVNLARRELGIGDLAPSARPRKSSDRKGRDRSRR